MAIQSNTVQLNSIYKKCHKECVPLPSHHHSLATMIMIIFLRWSLTMIVMVVANEFTNKPWEVNWTQVQLLKVRISTNCEFKSSTPLPLLSIEYQQDLQSCINTLCDVSSHNHWMSNLIVKKLLRPLTCIFGGSGFLFCFLVAGQWLTNDKTALAPQWEQWAIVCNWLLGSISSAFL